MDRKIGLDLRTISLAKIAKMQRWMTRFARCSTLQPVREKSLTFA
jgi:hypothetical protein